MTDAPELPPHLALAWGVAERPQKPQRRELSIESIVQAGVEIADAEGLAGLSMARVAKSLGFTTMSLYRYVTSKDDLLLLMQEAAFDVEFPPPHEPADWRAELREWTLFALAVYREHPWVLDLPITGAPMTPNSLRGADAGLRALRSTALDDGAKVATILLLSGYARNAAALGRDLDRAVAMADPDSPLQLHGITDVLRELVDEVRFPYLRPLIERGTYAPETPGLDDIEDVAWGLERTLDGIAVFIERCGGSGRPAQGAGEPVPPPTEGTDVETIAAVVQAYASDAKVKKAATRRKEAERRLREAQKKARELEKALREARRSEAEAAQAAADRAR